MLRRPDAPRLTVTNQTTLEQLRQFSDAAGGNAKIRGKQNSDGSITLYASTKKGTGLENKVQGDRGGKQATARFAVTMVLNRVKGDNLDTAMANVKGQLPPQGELRGGALGALVNQAQAARQGAVDAPRAPSLMAGTLQQAVVDGNAEALKHHTAELGKRMADHMQSRSPDEQTDFATSHGDAFKKHVLALMASGVHDPQPLLDSYNQGGAVKALLDDAYQQATQQLPNHQNGDGTLEIGGKTYAKDRHLAKGGFGSVDIYKAADGEQIAVKTPITRGQAEKAEKFDEAAREVEAHRSAVAGNPANVVGLKGVVRTPEGGLQIALEFASRGDAYSAIDKLNTAAQNGTITPQEANLARITIVKDMIEGLRHVQETRGMTHLDVKGPNYFVDGGGVVKLGDFGTAKAGNAQQLESNPIDNPRWAAPELIKGGNDRVQQIKDAKAQNRANYNAAVSNLSTNLPPAALKIATDNLLDQFEATKNTLVANVPLINISSKADTWSVGVELYKAFTNEFPFDSKWDSDVQDQLNNFVAFNGRVKLPLGNDFGLSRTELGQLNTLVGQLLHPDPQQRPTLTQALQNPLFQDPSVGGAQARAIIQQITT